MKEQKEILRKMEEQERNIKYFIFYNEIKKNGVSRSNESFLEFIIFEILKYYTIVLRIILAVGVPYTP
jgi:hypothetical protein